MPLLADDREHLVSVSRLRCHTGSDLELRAELKIDGVPLQRIDLGVFATPELANVAWAEFLARLEAG